MYHVLTIGITTLVLYLLSYFFCLNGLYTKVLHRKVWNIILAVAFILAALAGVFLALQITYKWNIPFVKTILKWHVECGTGLAFTGLIHFLRHFSYFIKRSGVSEAPSNNKKPVVYNTSRYSLNLFMIGFTTTSVQILLMREIMNISGGYELVTGTFLASWLIGSAAGSFAARKSEMADLKKLNLILGLNIVLSLLLMILFGRIYLNPGETPSFFISIVYTLIVLLPFTFISGFIFIRLVTLSGEHHRTHAGKAFSVETAGGVASGLLISILCFRLLDTYQMILLLVLLFFCYLFIEFIFTEKVKRIIVTVTLLLSAVIVILVSPDRFFRKILLPGINVISTQDTPYGNITLGKYAGEESLYYNQRLIRWHNDETEREENVHYAMLQHGNIRKVLVVSGDIASAIHEIAKYKPAETTFVERDPGLLKAEASLKLNDTLALKVISTDAYRFIRESNNKYDVILMIVPPPSTLLLNRFYTRDFFLELGKHLNKGGVVMCSPGTGENYFNKESSLLYSSIFNTLAGVFRNILPIVGNKLYYIASDDTLSAAVCSMVEKRGLLNTYVSSDFLSDDLILNKTEKFLKNIDRNAPVNILEAPVACFQFQLYNLSKDPAESIPSLILLASLFILPAFGVKRRNLLMYFSAGALAGFEIIMLILLQSTAGNIYQITGLILAGVMTGLALGSGMKLNFSGNYSFIINSVILILFYSAVALITSRLLELGLRIPGTALLVLMTLIPSFCTGQIFRAMTGVSGIVSASVYSADLAGSALSFIVVSGIAIPLLGISRSLFLLSAMIFTGLLFGTIGNKY